MSKKRKDKRWMRYRHRVVRNLLSAVLSPYIRIRYGIRIEKFKTQEKRPYLILLNHQTPFDQFFVGMAFKGPIYYLATEDIFSLGWISSLIRWLIAPIPIKKQTVDVRAVMNCLRVVKEGGTLCIAPEGNRTYSGRTEYMNPAIASMARQMKLPSALFRIEGGYGVEPRWSDVIRRGRMKAGVVQVISPEEAERMTDTQLMEVIHEGLYVDETKLGGEYRHKKAAEYVERVLYVCPFHGLSTFHSHRDTVTCQKCGRRFRYLPSKELAGIECEIPFRYLADWYDYQKDFMNRLDITESNEDPLYCESVRLSEVIPYKKKVLIDKQATVELYGDSLYLSAKGMDQVFPFDKTANLTVLGRNKLNIYHEGKIYQLKGSKRFNALKYVHISHRCQNIKKGEPHEQFLGL